MQYTRKRCHSAESVKSAYVYLPSLDCKAIEHLYGHQGVLKTHRLPPLGKRTPLLSSMQSGLQLSINLSAQLCDTLNNFRCSDMSYWKQPPTADAHSASWRCSIARARCSVRKSGRGASSHERSTPTAVDALVAAASLARLARSCTQPTGLI